MSAQTSERTSRRAASRLLQAQAQQPRAESERRQHRSPSAHTTNHVNHSSPSPRLLASTLAVSEWTLPCQYCGNVCSQMLPCCDAWRNHGDYVQLWRALNGIRNEFRRGTPERVAIDMWMEVEEYEHMTAEGGRTEEDRQRAVAAWSRLEEIRERLEDDHPVSRAMDQWLDNAEGSSEDGEMDDET